MQSHLRESGPLSGASGQESLRERISWRWFDLRSSTADDRITLYQWREAESHQELASQVIKREEDDAR
jgi:hypothetical protein